MSDIFDEVEENVKAEKLNKLWDKAWPFALGGSIAIVAMVGANSYFADQAKKEIETNGRAFEMGLKALEAQDLENARARFGDLLEKDTGFAALAAQHLAQAELEMAGDTEAAARALEGAAQGEGALADLAKLKAAYFLADTKSLAEVESALGDLTGNSGSFGALARELIAAKAFEEGDIERARSEYQALTLRLSIPEGVRSRANEALAVLPVNTASNEGEEIAPAEATQADTVEDPA